MKHTSRLFGEFSYEPDQIITFPSGLLGFPDCKRFVLKGTPKTSPICWLLSVDVNGPELAIVDPNIINPEYAVDVAALDHRLLEKLHCEDPATLLSYAIVTLPENVKQMSMNLRTPIFIDPASRRGLEYPKPGIEQKPVRCLIYRDLIASRPEDKPGTLVMTRKENETFEIGDEISVQILEFANGGVRLGISAPKHVKVRRGEGKVTPLCETKRANRDMNLHRLEGIMSMHHVMTSGNMPELAAGNESSSSVLAG